MINLIQTNFLYRLRKHNFKPLFTLMIGSAGSNLIYFFCFLILGVVLSNESFGHFRVAYAYIMVAVSVSHLGMNVSLTRLFPTLNNEQKKTALLLIGCVSLVTSLFLSFIVLLALPSLDKTTTSFDDFFYFIAFSFSVFGATCSNFILSILQATGELSTYSRFQFRWRALLLGGATLGGIFGGSFWALVLMPVSYVIIFSKVDKKLYHWKAICFANITFDWSIVSKLFRGGFWPLAAIAVSIFYGNAEFLYIKSHDIASGLAGSYSLASLIYMGGTSFFYPFQTYAVSKLVRQELSFNGIWRLQGFCFILVLCIAFVCFFCAHFLNWLYPIKFDVHFLYFSNIVILKLVLWGMYAVIGALLCYIGKEFESFLLTVFALFVLVSIPQIFHFNIGIALMVKMQILTSLIVLIGSHYLFYVGFSSENKSSL